MVKQTLVFKDGRTIAVTGEQGKYWLCGGVRFRKGNPAISEVREEHVSTVQDIAEGIAEILDNAAKRGGEKQKEERAVEHVDRIPEIPSVHSGTENAIHEAGAVAVPQPRRLDGVHP